MKANATWIDEEELFGDFSFNYTYSLFDDWPEENKPYRLALIWLEVIVGAVLNLLTIVIVCRGKRLDVSVGWLLLNVAVSDFLFCCIILFYEHVIHVYKHIPSLSLCRLTWFILNGVADSTMMWRVTISIEQFMAVRSSNTQVLPTQRKRKIAVAMGTWVISFLLSIHYTITAHLYHWTDTDGSLQSGCNIGAFGVGLTVTAIGAIMPVIVMFVLYVVIGQKLYCSSTYVHLEEQQTTVDVQVKQTSLMLAADAMTFALTWLPIQILNFMLVVGFYVDLSFDEWTQIYTVLHIVFAFKCFDTPIIYFATSPSFREDTKALFCRCCPVRDASSTPAATDTYQLVETELT